MFSDRVAVNYRLIFSKCGVFSFCYFDICYFDNGMRKPFPSQNTGRLARLEGLWGDIPNLRHFLSYCSPSRSLLCAKTSAQGERDGRAQDRLFTD